MKTMTDIRSKVLVKVSAVMAALLFILSPAGAQKKSAGYYLSLRKLPSGLTLKEKAPYSYIMTADYYNHDILGNFVNKMQVRGIYTRGLPDKKVRWNDVTISQSQKEVQPFPQGKRQEYMEGMTYGPSDDYLNLEAFKKFPPTTGMFARNLVWDVLTFEAFGWSYTDSLQLNVPFSAKSINGKLKLDSLGSFENKDIRLTWTGISTMNNKVCAVIEFITMDNPLEINASFMKMKGRSNYWGTLWLSLTDKQIEYGILWEDVNMDIKINGQKKSQLTNTSRKIEFKRF
ncbi:MAG TPA: hypothetical protein VJ963_01475 [Bacteroidales bacterium]|nr:hypothetical protein [Bacteroidales bacterium]